MVDTSLLTNAMQRVELTEYEKRLKEELAAKHADREDGEDDAESAIAEDAISISGELDSVGGTPKGNERAARHQGKQKRGLQPLAVGDSSALVPSDASPSNGIGIAGPSIELSPTNRSPLRGRRNVPDLSSPRAGSGSEPFRPASSGTLTAARPRSPLAVQPSAAGVGKLVGLHGLRDVSASRLDGDQQPSARSDRSALQMEPSVIAADSSNSDGVLGLRPSVGSTLSGPAEPNRPSTAPV